MTTAGRLVLLCASAAFVSGCDGMRLGRTRQDGELTTDRRRPEPADVRDAPPPEIRPQTRVSAGRMLEADGNFNGALEQYRQSVAAEPDNVEAYTRLGILCNRMGRFEEATTAFMRATEIAPDKAYLHNNLGFCYVLQNRFDDAEKCFRRALSIRPEYRRARMNLGAVYAHLGRGDDAVREFEKVVSRDAAYYDLGLILASNKKYAAAEKAFRHSLALNPASRDAGLQIERMVALRNGETAGVGGAVADGSPAPIGSSGGAAASDPAPAAMPVTEIAPDPDP